MREIEANFPKLINCFGLLELDKAEKGHRCYMCKHIYHCNQQRKELKGEEFNKGKYRLGFGRQRYGR